MGLAPTLKCKESAYWKHKQKEEYGGFDLQFLYHYVCYIGYNVANIIYNTIKVGNGAQGLAPEKLFTDAVPTMLENYPLQVS